MDITRSYVTKSLAKNLSFLAIFMPYKHVQNAIRYFMQIKIPKRIIEITSYNIGKKLISYFQKDLTPKEKEILYKKEFEQIEVQYFQTDGGHTPLIEKTNELDDDGKKLYKEETNKNQKQQKKNYREVKLGLFFTNSDVKKNGIKNKNTIENRKFSVSIRHGLNHFIQATKKRAEIIGALQANITVFISDGAKWCKTVQTEIFPNAIRILDWYHASEHLWETAIKLFGDKNKEAYTLWAKPIEELLWDGKIDDALKMIRETIDSTKKQTTDLWNLYHYYNKNKEAMKYKEFREKGFFIGSGAIESAIKYIMTSRFKLTGCAWRRDNAEALMWLRTKYFEDNWDGFWDNINYRQFLDEENLIQMTG